MPPWLVSLSCAPGGLLIDNLHQEYHDASDAAQRAAVALSRGLGETTVTSFDTLGQTLKIRVKPFDAVLRTSTCEAGLTPISSALAL